MSHIWTKSGNYLERNMGHISGWMKTYTYLPCRTIHAKKKNINIHCFFGIQVHTLGSERVERRIQKLLFLIGHLQEDCSGLRCSISMSIDLPAFLNKNTKLHPLPPQQQTLILRATNIISIRLVAGSGGKEAVFACFLGGFFFPFPFPFPSASGLELVPNAPAW